MFRLLLIPALFAVSSPAFAQMDHATMDHGNDHTHAETPMTAPDADAKLTLADQPDLAAALLAGGEPVAASVLGAVCDFCAMAMNKTFGKRDEVAAVYVDLDAKTLNLVLKPGATMSDETIRKTVKKAGYKVSEIARGDQLVSG
jgi:copper chaperone CopZ